MFCDFLWVYKVRKMINVYVFGLKLDKVKVENILEYLNVLRI